MHIEPGLLAPTKVLLANVSALGLLAVHYGLARQLREAASGKRIGWGRGVGALRLA